MIFAREEIYSASNEKWRCASIRKSFFYDGINSTQKVTRHFLLTAHSEGRQWKHKILNRWKQAFEKKRESIGFILRNALISLLMGATKASSYISLLP
jgi:hypothetical protein